MRGFDRLRLSGTFRALYHPPVMEKYIKKAGFLMKDFKQLMLPITGQIRTATQEIAERTGRPLTYLSSSQVRKEDVARQIARKDGISAGLIAILSCVEPCRTYTVGGNPKTKMLEAQLGLGKCLHYYFYHFHPVFGFIHLRLQSWFPFLIQYDLPAIQPAESSCLTNFAAQMLTLQDMAERELARQPYTDAETNMVLNLLEQHLSYCGRSQFNGRYPQPFYDSVYSTFDFDGTLGSEKWDALVTDVQTDPPNPLINDPGAVLHEAAGSVNLIMIAVDNGSNRMVYAGPVLSHYEFEVPGTTRLTDDDWQAQLNAAGQPPPDWTQSYLVPQ